MAKFILWQSSRDNLWYWHLKAANGEVVCWAEGYASKQGALGSIQWTRDYAKGADLEEL